MKIRRAILSDVPLLVSLNRGVQEMHADAFPERFRRDAPADAVVHAFTAMIDAPSSYWLVADEEQPIGFLSAEFRERDESWCLVPHRACYLAGIVVAPAFRRRGIARALLAELKREAHSRGVARIELDVWAFNEEAKHAFASLGFQSVMERMTLSTA
jgi:ribosomal protein S18 acetylase RimI-like enzyme